jgi:hypothetical protein
VQDPGFYPLLAHGEGGVFLIHCTVAQGRIQAALLVVLPGFPEAWAQLTSEADYQGDRCAVMLPSRCVNGSNPAKVYAVDLPYRPLS